MQGTSEARDADAVGVIVSRYRRRELKYPWRKAHRCIETRSCNLTMKAREAIYIRFICVLTAGAGQIAARAQHVPAPFTRTIFYDFPVESLEVRR